MLAIMAGTAAVAGTVGTEGTVALVHLLTVAQMATIVRPPSKYPAMTQGVRTMCDIET